MTSARGSGYRLGVPPAHGIDAELEVLDRVLGESPDAIVVVTPPPDSVFAYANAAFLRITGYRRDEVIGASPTMLEGPESEDSGLRELQEALLGGASYQGEVINYRRDGTPYWVQWSITPRRAPDGSLRYWIATQRDVTEQRESARKLARALGRLSFHVNNSPLGVIEWDRDFRVVSWSPQAEKILGWSYAEAVGRSSVELIGKPDTERMRELATTLVEGGARRTFGEVSCLHRDGSPRRLVWYNSSLCDDDGEVISILSLVQDVTEQRRASEEKARLERRMQRVQKLDSLGVLAGGIAHDFNNLLTGVVGHAGLALRELDERIPARKHVEHAMDAARHAAELTRQLLFYAGRSRYHVESLDLSDQVGAMADLLDTLTSSRVSVDFVLGSGLPPVEFDRAQIQQVVMNLVVNGAEACGEGPGSVIVRTEAVELDAPLHIDGWAGGELSPGTYVCLHVEDSGCGMDASTRERLFDPFFSTKFSGRGLGLAAVAGILRGNRGAIQVESTPGRGAVFRVLFPAAPGE